MCERKMFGNTHVMIYIYIDVWGGIVVVCRRKNYLDIHGLNMSLLWNVVCVKERCLEIHM
jgi:hypothetical protein